MANSSFQALPQAQVSVLELFFPGFSRISPIVARYTGINLDAVVPLLCLCGLLVFLYKRGYQDVSSWVQNYFCQSYLHLYQDSFLQLIASTVHISCHSEVHDMLLAWVSSQPFAQNSRSSLVTVDLKKGYSLGAHGSSRKHLQYAPWNGEFRFWYKNHPIVYRRVEKKGELFFREREELSVSCLGWSSRILKDLFEECRKKYLEDLKDKTLIFEARDGNWEQSKTRRIRQMSTVLHDDKTKETLLGDITNFLDPTTREWYNERGIPYRRGYLLYGPPGTGKSSLSLSIAGHFDLDIYILTLASVDDSNLNKLFAKLPQHCMILLEDVDVASHNRSQHEEADHSSESSIPEKKANKVTLSGLLNALDGVASQEGRLLIMTTNYVERLDDALIRPGRVDRKIEFQLADKDIAGQLFRIVFKASDSKINIMVERLADDFAGRVPASEFSPAEVLSLLLEHRHSPEDAVANVEGWVTTVREEKRKKLKREGPWVHSA
jgi:chaperone BCS1